MSRSSQKPDFVLNEVRNFTATLWWAPPEYIDVLTLILSVTHAVHANEAPFTSVPHCLVTSDSPGTGKTTAAAQIPGMLAFNPWKVGRLTTEPAINSRFLTRGDEPTLVCDDISKTFGDAGLNGRGSKLYSLLIECYLNTGTISVSVDRVAKDLPAFTVAFMNGLHNAVPDDLATRSIIMPVKPKPPKLRLQNALSPAVRLEADDLREALHGWSRANAESMGKFMLDGVLRVHPLLTDRRLQLWGPLFAVASAAGGAWPGKCMDAFRLLALDASEKPQLLTFQRCLLDVAGIIMATGAERLFTSDVITALRDLPDGENYRKMDSNYLVQTLLPKALGPSADMRGITLAGQDVHGKARYAAQILEAAASLREELYGPDEEQPPDATQLELALVAAR